VSPTLDLAFNGQSKLTQYLYRYATVLVVFVPSSSAGAI
jgi:hypothetical protein